MTALETLQGLSAKFDSSEVKQYTKEWTNKRGEKMSAGPFHYVPDERVMDRLDGVAGPGNWTFDVEPTASGAVKGTLSIRWEEGGPFISYSDFGYPTRDDSAEPLKEAVSDVIRRLGRFVGVARYVYRGELDSSSSVQRSSAPAPSPAPADFDMAEVDRAASDAACAKHHVSWLGSPYTPGADRSGRYHKDGVWEDSGKTKWCRHPADEAAKKAARG